MMELAAFLHWKSKKWQSMLDDGCTGQKTASQYWAGEIDEDAKAEWCVDEAWVGSLRGSPFPFSPMDVICSNPAWSQMI